MNKKKKMFEKKTDILRLFFPTIVLLIECGIYYLVPNAYPVGYEPEVWPQFLLVAAAFFAVLSLIGLIARPLRTRLVKYCFVIAAFCILMGIYDLLTLKSGILQPPMWYCGDKIVIYFMKHWTTLLTETGVSLGLLGRGLIMGVLAGAFCGTLSGISKVSNYWIAPLLRIIGPIPPLVMMPITFAMFPKGNAAATVLIMWAMWFPLTLKLTAAIRNLPPDVLECARVLGASKLHVVIHVIIPLVLPAVFQGLFMGLSSSFGTMGAVEALGSPGGIIYDLNVNSDLCRYYGVYAIFPILVACFSIIVRILFWIRDYCLRWQKGYKRG